MDFIDVNASYGHWPFARLPKRSGKELESHLSKHGIKKALVSHLETIFVPDPDPANRELIKICEPSDVLLPVPVLNLTMPDWLENLESYRSSSNIKAVKLYPNFQNFSLNTNTCKELVSYLETHKIRLIINIRMVDERHQYFGLKVNGVTTKQIVNFAKSFPDFGFLCTGLFRTEILDLAEKCPNARMDLSFADWHDLINELTKTISAQRLLYGSHTPLMVTKANTFKLEASQIPDVTKEQIASGNARAFFGL